MADGTPGELKRLVPGGRIRLEFNDAEELDAAAAVFRDATRDDAGARSRRAQHR